MRRGVGVPIAFLVVVAAGCSDGSGAADPLDSTEVSDEAAPSSTEVERSTPATIPPTASTEPETTDPTTTVDPTDQLIADIEADLNAGEQVFLAGAGDPASEESRTNLERFFTETALEIQLEFYDWLVEEGLIARANTEVPSEIRITRLVSQQGDDAAEIEFCRVDAGVVVDPLPDGAEAIVNDVVTRYEYRARVELVNDVWVSPGGGETLSESVGVLSCGEQ